MKIIDDFKQFIMRGNVVDMAVGIIIGGAFGKIVTSLVNDIIMPPIGWLIGGVDFTKLQITLPNIKGTLHEVTWNYGAFLQEVINFLIIAVCIFFLIKSINKLSSMKKKEEPASSTPAGPTDIELLTEIRNILKSDIKNNARST